jgi:hypothetical protein
LSQLKAEVDQMSHHNDNLRVAAYREYLKRQEEAKGAADHIMEGGYETTAEWLVSVTEAAEDAEAS